MIIKLCKMDKYNLYYKNPGEKYLALKILSLREKHRLCYIVDVVLKSNSIILARILIFI